MGAAWTVSLRPLGVLLLMAGVAGGTGSLLLVRAARGVPRPLPA